ncbi:helix-turn-helix domain-containing protein [Marinicrinis sediminis]|uniref:Helix-turn-helix domain-containing protein n=1 Tax=Marinicrinis sediminis TaxID=1652465 RepID=A0ABW5REN2_9BACL
MTDIKMPEMDGLELSRIVCDTYPNVPILIISGYDEFSLAKEALQYGVNDYLLKPIVRDELAQALKRIANDIAMERNKELAYRAMLNVSESAKKQVIKQFLKAVITDHSVEIKALYPLLYRFKINLIESEGMILILSLDTAALLQKPIPASDIPVFKFILNQAASEWIEESGNGWVFSDEEENTIVFLAGEDREALRKQSAQIFQHVSDMMKTSTGIPLVAAAGTAEHEVLQLHVSYQNARKMLGKRLYQDQEDVFHYDAHDPHLHTLMEWDKMISLLQSGLLNRNKMIYYDALNKWMAQMETSTSVAVIRYGLYLLEALTETSHRFQGEQAVQAGQGLNILKQFAKQTSAVTDERVQQLFADILHIFASTEQPEVDEHDAVLQAQKYIYMHYAEPLSLALIAEKIGVSSSYLSNIFHKSMGESYIKFLTRVRMEQAAKLLVAEQPLKIYEIAEKVGYISVKHFSHVFKQTYKMPPGTYQEAYDNMPRGT